MIASSARILRVALFSPNPHEVTDDNCNITCISKYRQFQTRASNGVSISGVGGAPTTQQSTLGQMSNIDILALAVIVMMEAAQDAQNDLRSMLDGMKRTQLEQSHERQILKIVGQVTQSLNSPRWRPHAR